MDTHSRELLISFIQRHTVDNEIDEDLTALSDDELSQRAQIIQSAQELKKNSPPDN